MWLCDCVVKNYVGKENRWDKMCFDPNIGYFHKKALIWCERENAYLNRVALGDILALNSIYQCGLLKFL